MVTELDRSELVRGALLRKGLADVRQRAALARDLDVSDSEVLAMQHLARAGELTPGQLGTLLQLSSGGVTALIDRLQRGGHVTRQGSARDRRSTTLRLTEAIAARASEAWSPFVAEIDRLVLKLSERDCEVVYGFVEAAAEAAQRHADRLVRDADVAARDRLAVPLPALWS